MALKSGACGSFSWDIHSHRHAMHARCQCNCCFYMNRCSHVAPAPQLTGLCHNVVSSQLMLLISWVLWKHSSMAWAWADVDGDPRLLERRLDMAHSAARAAGQEQPHQVRPPQRQFPGAAACLCSRAAPISATRLLAAGRRVAAFSLLPAASTPPEEMSSNLCNSCLRKTQRCMCHSCSLGLLSK